MLATPEKNAISLATDFGIVLTTQRSPVLTIFAFCFFFIRFKKANTIPELLKLQLAAGHSQDANKLLLFNSLKQIMVLEVNLSEKPLEPTQK